MSNDELLDLFREGLDAALELSPKKMLDETQTAIEAVKGGTLPVPRAHALTQYQIFASEVQRMLVRSRRRGISVEAFRKSLLAAAGKFARSHSLDEVTSDDSRHSDALTLFWRFLQWHRKETRRGER